jgi:signal peptidase II
VSVLAPRRRADAWLWGLGVCVLVVVVDQVAKAAIRSGLSPHQVDDLPLGFQLVRVANHGVAFGFLGGGGALVVAVTIAALVFVIGWFARDPLRPWLWLAVGLIAGGALGNLADRISDGAVTDFIDPPLWPAFNLADVAITVGAVALVLIALTPEPKQR